MPLSPRHQNKPLYLILNSKGLKVSHSSDGLWWAPGEAALCPPSPEVASDWSSGTAAGLWLAVIPPPLTGLGQWSPHITMRSSHVIHCQNIKQRPSRIRSSLGRTNIYSGLPSHYHFHTNWLFINWAVKTISQTFRKLKAGKYISKLQFELLPAEEARPRPGDQSEERVAQYPDHWIGQEAREQKRGRIWINKIGNWWWQVHTAEWGWARVVWRWV